MVQVDVFWSYGLASGLALAAQKTIKNETDHLASSIFIKVMLWISIFFAPSGAYLLWNFPAWETMFLAIKHEDIPAWVVCLFCVTNITQAWLGYYVTWRFIRAGRFAAAKFQAIWSHFAMLFILIVGWDGTGLKRFTYAGTGTDWVNGVVYDWVDFFSAPIFFTLVGMGFFLIPTYVWLVRQFQKPSMG